MNLFGFIPVSFRDVLDILLVSVFVYLVLRVLGGIKVVTVIVGFGIISAVGILGKVLNLPSVSILASVVQTFGIVLLIVIFQPELRKLFMEMASFPLIRFFVPPERVPVEEIISAVEEILRRRLGALIVIERRVPLNEYSEETGVIMDAKLSAALLISIFEKRSPLHDGAVIIKNDRIVACSVMLPMSVRYKEIGARHRAGAGITEVSDAISIVISEEKGAITLFQKGESYYNITVGKLRDYLTRLLKYERI